MWKDKETDNYGRRERDRDGYGSRRGYDEDRRGRSNDGYGEKIIYF